MHLNENKSKQVSTRVMNNSSVADIEWDVHPPLSSTVRLLLAVFLITAFVVGTIGNITVLALFIKYKSLRTTSNIFVINLTAADLMMCLVSLPMLINSYLRGFTEEKIERFFCNFDTFLGAFTGFLSIWSLVCLAVDRYIVITRQLLVRYSSDKVIVSLAVVGVWILALSGAGLPFIGFGQYALKGADCGASENFSKSFSNMFYNIMLQILYFIIPITCIVSCYVMIFIEVRNHELRYFDRRKGGPFDRTAFRRTCRSRTYERNELKTAKAGLILIAVFCLSWTPFSIVSWIGLFGNRDILTPLAVAIPAIFAKVSTLLNPLLYALLLRSFKSKLSLCCKTYFNTTQSSCSGSGERVNIGLLHNPRTTYPSVEYQKGISITAV